MGSHLKRIVAVVFSSKVTGTGDELPEPEKDLGRAPIVSTALGSTMFSQYGIVTHRHL